MHCRFITGVLAFVCAFSAGADWPDWLGPNETGAISGGTYPAYWSRYEGVAWTVDLKIPATSAPIVWQDQIFIATRAVGHPSTTLLALDRRSGKTRWSHKFPEVLAQATANQTVALQTDGKHLVVSLLNGNLHVLDLAGKELWTRSPAQEAKLPGSAISPATRTILQDGKIIVLLPVTGEDRDRDPGCHLIAFRINDGSTAWVQRHSWESKKTGSKNLSLIPFADEAGKSLLAAVADTIICARSEDGKEAWRTSAAEMLGNAGKTNDIALFGDGLIVAAATEGNGLAAGKVIEGKFTLLWNQSSSVNLAHPHPLSNGSAVSALSQDTATMEGIDARTGRSNWSIPMPRGDWTQSPLLGADGKVYGLSTSGEVIVADTASGKMLSRTPMRGGAFGSGLVGLALSHGNLFVCDGRQLSCVTGAQLTVSGPKGVSGERIGEPEKIRRRLPK